MPTTVTCRNMKRHGSHHPTADTICTGRNDDAPAETLSYGDAQHLWVAATGKTVREHLYDYGGVLGKLVTADDVAMFTATDGYGTYACTAKLESVTSSRFIFTATKVGA